MRNKELTNQITEFSRGLIKPKRVDIGNYTIKSNGEYNKDGIYTAIWLGTADYSPRGTLKRISNDDCLSSDEEIDNVIRESIVGRLAAIIGSEGFFDYLCEWFSNTEDSLSKESFDKWHYAACMNVLSSLSMFYTNKDGSKVKFGKAQKIVNMTLKYLYCFKDAEKHEEYFEFCHMPIDRYILQWVFEQDKSIKKGTPPWSFFEYSNNNEQYINERYSYNFIKDSIDYLVESSDSYGIYTPLQAEFFIWEEIIKKEVK